MGSARCAHVAHSQHPAGDGVDGGRLGEVLVQDETRGLDESDFSGGRVSLGEEAREGCEPAEDRIVGPVG